MRTIVDAEGRAWDVAVMEASYGALRFLFAPRDGGELRAHELDVNGRYEAEQLLLRLVEAELQALLKDAPAWRLE